MRITALIFSIFITMVIIGCTPNQLITEQYPTQYPTQNLIQTKEISKPIIDACLQRSADNGVPQITNSKIALLKGNEPILLDISNNIWLNLPLANVYGVSSYAVSPNNQYLAYFSRSKMGDIDSAIEIVDIDGKTIRKLTVNGLEWWGIDSWLNDDQVLIDKRHSLPDIALATPVPLILYSPFINEVQELSETFPDMVYLYPQLFWINYGFSATGYNNSLSFVIYGSDDNQYVLWDMAQKKEVLRLSSPIGVGGKGPVWTRDGTKFLINIAPSDAKSQEELILVDRAGNLEYLTAFSSLYSDVSINNYQWSPDMSRIAFLWRSDDSNEGNWQLALIDINTAIITNLCLSVDQLPYWSSDNKYILISDMSIRPYETKYSSYLVDLENNEYFFIGDDTQAMGWLMK